MRKEQNKWRNERKKKKEELFSENVNIWTGAWKTLGTCSSEIIWPENDEIEELKMVSLLQSRTINNSVQTIWWDLL